MTDIALLLAGFVCAGFGGELFVRGVVSLARWASVPAGIVAATVAAFATSSPELAVALISAGDGVPQISFGNVLGANIVNLGLSLGTALLISRIKIARRAIQRDLWAAALAPLATLLVVLDGYLSRTDGTVMLALFAAWLFATVIEARREWSAAAAVLGETGGIGRIVLQVLFGLASLVAAGKLVVAGGEGLGAGLGLPPFVVGATIVAIGTTLPEFATVVIARLRGHDEVGVGTLLGSLIFNGLFIAGLTATIRPFAVSLYDSAVALGTGLVLVLLIYPSRAGMIERRQGAALLGFYLTYLVVLLRSGAD